MVPWLILPCLSLFGPVEEDDVDLLDVSRVPAELLRNVEADTYWCVSKLLDGIQVSLAPRPGPWCKGAGHPRGVVPEPLPLSPSWQPGVCMAAQLLRWCDVR